MSPLWSSSADRFGDIEGTVKDVLARVQKEGDDALVDYTQQFDGVVLTTDDLLVPLSELVRAAEAMDPALRTALEEGAKRLRSYYQALAPQGGWAPQRHAAMPEFEISIRTLPLQRVGVYVPGGRFPLVSSLPMGVIPAQVAGVEDIVVATPPSGHHDGLPDPAILGSAYLLGIERVYRVGGAQAIAALAYGTATVPRVDKIVGPGNRYVACAKKLVYGDVGIDMIAGPTEIMIVADASLHPDHALADCLAQLEHGPDSRAFVVSPYEEAITRFEDHLAKKSFDDEMQERLARNLHLVVTETMDDAAELANRIAPEHLELCTRNTAGPLSRIRHAGAIFLGDHTPEAACDYFAGGNHVLPTEGTARFASALGPWDFIRHLPVTHLSEKALWQWLPHGLAIAGAEGLTHHGNSLKARFPEEDAQGRGGPGA